ALEDAGVHARVGDAVDDVGDEHVDHDVLARPAAAIGRAPRSPAQQEAGQFVERVDPGGDDDVEVDLGVHPLDVGDGPAEAEGGEVDDGVDAVLLQLTELGDGLDDPRLLVAAPAQRRPVEGDLGREHEDVLVHERGAQRAGVDGAPYRVDLWHGSPPGPPSTVTVGRIGYNSPVAELQYATLWERVADTVPDTLAVVHGDRRMK